DRAELCKRVAQVPVADRENQRRLQYATNTSAYLINRLYKEGYLRRALRRTRPLLSPKHMSDRLKYCVDRVQRTMDGRYFFDPMYDVVHLDEKWLYMKKVGKHVYILTGKDDVPNCAMLANYPSRCPVMSKPTGALALPSWDLS
ncbi:hypothetical protein PF008_g9723, partial [Phytophthora fragariae]